MTDEEYSVFQPGDDDVADVNNNVTTNNKEETTVHDYPLTTQRSRTQKVSTRTLI